MAYIDDVVMLTRTKSVILHAFKKLWSRQFEDRRDCGNVTLAKDGMRFGFQELKAFRYLKVTISSISNEVLKIISKNAGNNKSTGIGRRIKKAKEVCIKPVIITNQQMMKLDLWMPLSKTTRVCTLCSLICMM